MFSMIAIQTNHERLPVPERASGHEGA